MLFLLIVAASTAYVQTTESVPDQQVNTEGNAALPLELEIRFRNASFELNTFLRKLPQAAAEQQPEPVSEERSEMASNAFVVTSASGQFLERTIVWVPFAKTWDVSLRAWNGNRFTVVKPRRSVRHYDSATPEKHTAFPYGPIFQAVGFNGSMADFCKPEAFVTFRQGKDRIPNSDLEGSVYERSTGKEGAVTNVIQLFFAADDPLRPVCCRSFTESNGVRKSETVATILDWAMNERSLHYGIRVETQDDPLSLLLTKVHGEQISREVSSDVFEFSEYVGNPLVTSFVRGEQVSQASYYETHANPDPIAQSVTLTWFAVNDVLLIVGALAFFWKKVRFSARACSLVVALCMSGLQSGCTRQDNKTINVEFSEPANSEIQQWEKFQLQFTIKGTAGNPYDSREISADFEFTTPSGKKVSHPAFFVAEQTVVIENGRESVRPTGSEHWEVRWTPSEIGTYQWTLQVRTKVDHCFHNGQLKCTPGAKRGFACISQKDSRYFETSDGSFFFPVGHHTRSPDDDRSNASGNNQPRFGSLKTARYDQWFQRMSENGENFCEIWMSPCWLGLEWSPAQPGYSGLGQYNQIHAAQLDRVLELAEKHGICVMLYTMNHGQLSSAIDREWSESPYNSKNGGPVDTPGEFLKSEECLQRQQDRLRYILARWGYSTSLFGMTLCSEIDWIDPFYGKEAVADSPIVDGVAQYKRPILQDRAGVEDWFAKLSRFVKKTDAHGHIVTVQRSHIEDSARLWSNPCFDVVFPNAYRTQLESHFVTENLGRPAFGIADGSIGLARSFEGRTKPLLIAEWGGHHLRNPPSVLGADLHTGIWAMSMSEMSGVTGFWWWIDLDRADLYGNFRALTSFWGGIDRRNKNYSSTISSVLFNMPVEEEKHELVTHPTREAVLLGNETELYGYVYDLHMNMGNVPADRNDDVRYQGLTELFIDLPPRLAEGLYRVEYWDTFKGQVINAEEVAVGTASQVQIRKCGTDLAFKMTRIGAL